MAAVAPTGCLTVRSDGFVCLGFCEEALIRNVPWSGVRRLRTQHSLVFAGTEKCETRTEEHHTNTGWTEAERDCHIGPFCAGFRSHHNEAERPSATHPSNHAQRGGHGGMWHCNSSLWHLPCLQQQFQPERPSGTLCTPFRSVH